MSYLTDGMIRVAAGLEEAIPGSVAVPRYYYAQSKLPYMTMRIAAYAPFIDSEQIEFRPYVCIIRYVMGHVTDMPANAEVLMYQNIPIIESWYAQHNMLQSTAYPEPFGYLDPTGVYCTLSQGLTEFPPVAGIGAYQQIGSEFHLRLSFSIDVPQLY